ncbi:type III restriction protein res subunit [Candidatus Magnetoovum chiemensis]|nr:type III restriction protein res subunit [Candidatus Magnetoovum chiemensis]
MQKKEPNNYLDILSIIQHPEFMKFYDDLDDLIDVVGETHDTPKDKGSVLGDIIKVGLKENYKDYDLYIPIIVKEQEEELRPVEFSLDDLNSFYDFPLEKLKSMAGKGERFVSEELTVRTRFGEYEVTANLFTAKSYNEFLEKILHVVTTAIGRVGKRKTKHFPLMQINQVDLIRLIDKYIKYKLFNQEFNPFEGNNWKILLLHNAGVTQHIVKEISKKIYEMQNNIEINEAVINKRYFSEVSELRMRENYSLELAKTIYKRVAYPSNKGEFERDFMPYTDSDSLVESFIKVNEHYHIFASIAYIRTDGIISFYYPDFIVKTNNKIYVTETTATKDLQDPNVKQKQLSALEWIQRINKLSETDRMYREWEYVLLGQDHFYTLKNNGASIEEILNLAKLTDLKIKNISGSLF